MDNYNFKRCGLVNEYKIPESIDENIIAEQYPDLNPVLAPITNPKSYRNLNWKSVHDLSQHINTLSKDQQKLVRSILDIDNQVTPHKCNIMNSLLLVCSQGYRNDYIANCISFTKHRYTPCDTWRLCPRCAFYESRKFKTEWVPLWKSYRGRVNFVTISAVNKYQEGYDMVYNQEGIIDFWNSVAKKVNNLMRYKKMDGVLYSEELAILSLNPLKVNPHVHMIVYGDFPADKFKDFDVVVKQPDTFKDYMNVVSYLIKSINLWSCYDKEWARDNSESINRQMEEFTRGFGCLVWRRKQLRKLGICHKAKKKTRTNGSSSALRRVTKLFNKGSNKHTKVPKPNRAHNTDNHISNESASLLRSDIEDCQIMDTAINEVHQTDGITNPTQPEDEWHSSELNNVECGNNQPNHTNTDRNDCDEQEFISTKLLVVTTDHRFYPISNGRTKTYEEDTDRIRPRSIHNLMMTQKQRNDH